VLDIGSNTGHLLVVDAIGGAAPLPTYSFKEPLRLAEHLDAEGMLRDSGISALIDFVKDSLAVAEDQGCEEILGFATSAVRDSGNTDEVLDRLGRETGVTIDVLSGEDEAKLTFLAVRRWFGWSSGRLLVFDIGGGSLEIAAGDDEAPEVAHSLPLGAARLTRDWISTDPPSPDETAKMRKHIRAEMARDAGPILRGAAPDHAAATSKTFRSLARICGAAPRAEGPRVKRYLRRDDLGKALARLVEMTAEERLQLPGVSPSREHQLVAGALVAEAAMDLFGLDEMEICPWALREGVLLERIDEISIISGGR
jgi:exopolyphosphatase/guanosine-5'-triphosphate,3'-diphosphate pyrophosphatase